MVRDSEGTVSKWMIQQLAKNPKRANGKIIKPWNRKGQKRLQMNTTSLDF